MAARVALAPCVQAWAMRSSEMQSRRSPTSKRGRSNFGGTQKRNKKSRFDDPPINHRDQTCPALAVFVNVNEGWQDSNLYPLNASQSVSKIRLPVFTVSCFAVNKKAQD
jgi:hypothetical protein